MKLVCLQSKRLLLLEDTYPQIVEFAKPYIFLIYQFKIEKIMIKILEIIGLVLIGGTVYSYLGMIGDPLRWPVFFWLCCRGSCNNYL